MTEIVMESDREWRRYDCSTGMELPMVWGNVRCIGTCDRQSVWWSMWRSMVVWGRQFQRVSPNSHDFEGSVLTRGYCYVPYHKSTLSLSLSVQWHCRRHIVGSLHHHMYIPSASLAKFCVILGPPSSYQTRSRNKPFHSTSLLHLAPLSLCNHSHVSGHGNLWS